MKKHATARRLDVVLQPHSGHTRPDTDPPHAPGPGGEMLLTDVSAQPASPHHCRRKSVSHSAPRLASPGSVTWSPTPASAVPPGQRDTIQPRVRGQAIAGPAPPVSPSGPGRNHRTSWGPKLRPGVAKVLAGDICPPRRPAPAFPRSRRHPPAPANFSPATTCDPAEWRNTNENQRDVPRLPGVHG